MKRSFADALIFNFNKITIISAVSASCGSVFVLQIVCWPFLQRFVCSSADKLSETATSGGNCRREAHSAMLWNTVQSVEIQRNALKYSRCKIQ